MKLSVKDVLEEIKAEDLTKPNRYSKEKFDKLLLAIANDTEFKGTVAEIKNGIYMGDKEVELSKGLRKWVKGVLESVGMDRDDASVVLNEDFNFKNVDGLQDFIAHALYEFVASGNSFKLPTKEDFDGGPIYMKQHEEMTKVRSAINPQTKEELGEFETTYPKHRTLETKSSCPKYLRKRKKI